MAQQKKSFQKMLLDSKGNPADLKREVEENSAFSLTEEQAALVLGKGAKTGSPTSQELGDSRVFGNNTPMARMGLLFGKETNTAWAVGTHTHTPVMVFAGGPEAEKFRGLIDNVEIPQIIVRAWGASLPEPK